MISIKRGAKRGVPSRRALLSFTSSISAFLAIRTFLPLQSTSRFFLERKTSGDGAYFALSSPSATSRDALFTAARRKKRFMILVSSSALVFVGSAAAPLPHFSRCNVSLHEFLANARDRWKQLFRAVGTTTVNKAGVLLRSNDSSIASACLPRCFSRHGAKRTIDRFADFALRLGSIFKRDVLTNGRNISSCLLSSFEVER